MGEGERQETKGQAWRGGGCVERWGVQERKRRWRVGGGQIEGRKGSCPAAASQVKRMSDEDRQPLVSFSADLYIFGRLICCSGVPMGTVFSSFFKCIRF